jgi:hypothetical protein
MFHANFDDVGTWPPLSAYGAAHAARNALRIVDVVFYYGFSHQGFP